MNTPNQEAETDIKTDLTTDGGILKQYRGRLIQRLEYRKQELEAEYWEGLSTHGGSNVRVLPLAKQFLQVRIREIDEIISIIKEEDGTHS